MESAMPQALKELTRIHTLLDKHSNADFVVRLQDHDGPAGHDRASGYPP